MELTQAYIKSVLHYEPATGVFTDIVQRSKRTPAGAICTSRTADGYRNINICGKKYLQHRVAFLYMEGSMPVNCVDHINGIRSDNRWKNLRHATVAMNGRNTKTPKNNTSGVCGVYWTTTTSKWRAQIKHNYQAFWLGDFNDWFEAVCARKSAEITHGFHPNHGRAGQ